MLGWRGSLCTKTLYSKYADGEAQAEDRSQLNLRREHPAMAWTVAYAVVLLNRCEVGKDDRTAFERAERHRVRREGLLPEAPQWRPSGKAKQHVGPISERGDDCRQCHRSLANQLCAAPSRSRALRARGRRPHWRSHGRRRTQIRRQMDRWKVELGVRLPQPMKLMRHTEDSVPPGKFLIKQSDLNTHCLFDGCRGCTSITADRGRQPHSEGCRKRLELAMVGREREEGTATIAEAKFKEHEFLARTREAEATGGDA